MSQPGQTTICGEDDTRNPGFSICGRPAVGPHPIDGYTRPLCRMHMIEATTELEIQSQASNRATGDGFPYENTAP